MKLALILFLLFLGPCFSLNSGIRAYIRAVSGTRVESAAGSSSSTVDATPAVYADDLYGVLGVSKNSTSREIKSAYWQLATKYHPDRDDSPQALEIFRNASYAYQILGKDKKTRDLYDSKSDTKGFLGALEELGSDVMVPLARDVAVPLITLTAQSFGSFAMPIFKDALETADAAIQAAFEEDETTAGVGRDVGRGGGTTELSASSTISSRAGTTGRNGVTRERVLATTRTAWTAAARKKASSDGGGGGREEGQDNRVGAQGWGFTAAAQRAANAIERTSTEQAERRRRERIENAESRLRDAKAELEDVLRSEEEMSIDLPRLNELVDSASVRSTQALNAEAEAEEALKECLKSLMLTETSMQDSRRDMDQLKECQQATVADVEAVRDELVALESLVVETKQKLVNLQEAIEAMGHDESANTKALESMESDKAAHDLLQREAEQRLAACRRERVDANEVLDKSSRQRDMVVTRLARQGDYRTLLERKVAQFTQKLKAVTEANKKEK